VEGWGQDRPVSKGKKLRPKTQENLRVPDKGKERKTTSLTKE
jgi:hypothetical protein